MGSERLARNNEGNLRMQYRIKGRVAQIEAYQLFRFSVVFVGANHIFSAEYSIYLRNPGSRVLVIEELLPELRKVSLRYNFFIKNRTDQIHNFFAAVGENFIERHVWLFIIRWLKALVSCYLQEVIAVE